MVAVPYFFGQMLLAMPGIADQRFERAVIALSAHDDDGAMGVGIVTHINTLRLHELLRQVETQPRALLDAPFILAVRQSWSCAFAAAGVDATLLSANVDTA